MARVVRIITLALISAVLIFQLLIKNYLRVLHSPTRGSQEVSSIWLDESGRKGEYPNTRFPNAPEDIDVNDLAGDIFDGEEKKLALSPSTRFSKDAYFMLMSSESDENDYFFRNLRILIFQLLHKPETRDSKRAVIVIVIPKVAQWKKDRLLLDGAQIMEEEAFTPKNLSPESERWKHTFLKLKLWKMVQFERIVYIDSDFLLLRRIDDIWNEFPIHTHRKPKKEDVYQWVLNKTQIKIIGDLEDHYPYTFSAVQANYPHSQSPPPRPYGYMNTGLFILAPSLAHYASLMYNADNTLVPIHHDGEQGFINEYFMDWTYFPINRLDPKWNVNWAIPSDLNNTYLLHGHYWLSTGYHGGNVTLPPNDARKEELAILNTWPDIKLTTLWWKSYFEVLDFHDSRK